MAKCAVEVNAALRARNMPKHKLPPNVDYANEHKERDPSRQRHVNRKWLAPKLLQIVKHR
jgi:hypothetical protein